MGGGRSPSHFDWENNMARFLVSLNTGVVLPFCEAALKSPGVRETTSEESAAYEASVKANVKVEPMDVTPVPAEPLIEVAEPEVEVEAVSVVTQDISEGEPDVEAVLGALETD